MKLKHITAILAFAAAFGFSVLLIGVPQENFAARMLAVRADNENARQISHFLRQDIDNGRVRDANAELVSSPAAFVEVIEQYAIDCEKLDDTNLPTNFRNAWRDHKEAWRTHSDFLKQSDLSNEEINKPEFLETYRNQDKQIEKTWFDVLGVAVEYGTIIPRDAY